MLQLKTKAVMSKFNLFKSNNYFLSYSLFFKCALGYYLGFLISVLMNWVVTQEIDSGYFSWFTSTIILTFLIGVFFALQYPLLLILWMLISKYKKLIENFVIYSLLVVSVFCISASLISYFFEQNLFFLSASVLGGFLASLFTHKSLKNKI